MTSGPEDDKTLVSDAVPHDEFEEDMPTLTSGRRGSLPAGAMVANRYEIQACLGKGAMGEVYRVHDHELDEIVALKRLTVIDSETARERFRREVRLARRVTHRNVARTHDLGTHGGVPFLTMELVQGRSLDELLEERGKLAVEFAIPLAIDVLQGLAAAHEAGVVHRDLKPGNVLLASDGRVVLTDFGLARTDSTELEGSEKLTSKAQLVGTPRYMAPEQLTGATLDARTDIYSFGVMLYELLTGDAPFSGDSALKVAMARLLQDPPDIRGKDAEIPESVATLVHQCLAREPDERPGSVNVVVEGLLRWREGGMGSPMRTAAPLPTKEPQLAALPFEYRGPAEDSYLGEAMAEELTNVLSRMGGLRVMAFGATRRLEAGIDPLAAGKELGADLIVSGTIQRRGKDILINTRLMEVASATQRWSQRYTGALEDIFTLQAQLSHRIAESLRLVASTTKYGRVPAEALSLYFRARRGLNTDGLSSTENEIADLARCVALAPDFAPAHAFLAVTRVRAWFADGLRKPEANLGELATAALERASEMAPNEPDTHLARGTHASQLYRHEEAVASLVRALELAPTLPYAHFYLGQLQMEAGRSSEAEARLKLALELDPNLTAIAGFMLLRIAVFDGREDLASYWRGRIEGSALTQGVPYRVLYTRIALWRRDLPTIREFARTLTGEDPITAVVRYLVNYVAEHAEAGPTEAAFETFFAGVDSGRLRNIFGQMLAESHCMRGEIDRAFAQIDALAEAGMADIDWLERCPVLEPVRAHAGYAARHSVIDAHAAKIRTPYIQQADELRTWD